MANGNAAARLSEPVEDRSAPALLKRKFAMHNAVLVAAFFAILLLTPLVPGFKGWMAGQAALVIVYIIAAQGISILTGYTGQISLGHGAFMAIGGYTTAILMTDHGVKDVATIPIASVVAGSRSPAPRAP